MRHGSRISCTLLTTALALVLTAGPTLGQGTSAGNDVIERIWAESESNAQIYRLGQTLTDSIGPRLTGSPGLQAAEDWVVATYRSWGIQAEKQEYGTWESWEEGITHLDLMSPRRVALEAQTLAWTSGTDGPVEGPVLTLPDVQTRAEFQRWLASEVGGAIVLLSFPQPTCRPDSEWERHGTPESVEAMRADREQRRDNWNQRVAASGVRPGQLPGLLEQSGAIAVLTSDWAGSWGTNRVFSGNTRTIPMLDVGCEDYGMLARLAENDQNPTARVESEARFLGQTPVFNVMAMIEGTERPDEYVLLSAHLDTWHGATGATDNATGTITMMEAMRILNDVLPRPKRTIIAGHWGGEEQGLNGSAAFAEDSPDVLRGLQLVLNQDNGTGRITNIGMQGFTEAGAYFNRWLAAVPPELSRFVELDIPGAPDSGRSDHASFVCHGVPAFRLGSAEWDYRDYTWHTNRDTFDKVAVEEVRWNSALTAMLAYFAAEEPDQIPRDRTTTVTGAGRSGAWPSCRTPMRAAP